MAIVYKEESYKIMGCGFMEAVYQEWLETKFWNNYSCDSWFQYKHLIKSFPVFSTLLAAGLQPAAQCRRVANPAGAMLENLWSGT